MLTSSEYLNSTTTAEDNDLSTYLIIPFDSLKHSDDFSRLRFLQDGTLYLLPENQVLERSIPSTLENAVEVQSEEACNQSVHSVMQESSKLEQDDMPFCEPPGNSNSPATLPSSFNMKYDCMKCEKTFATVKEYKDHLKWHKIQKAFKCGLCGASYNVEDNLKIHNALVHPSGTISRCPICDVSLTFQRTASLKSHLMVHLVEEVHTCEECHAEIDKEEEFAEHMIAHATRIKAVHQSLTCSHCDVSFETKQLLKLHMTDHSKAWKFFRKKKVTKVALKEKRWICGKCGKSFIKQSLLDRHERIHNGEKPFKCDICDQCFTQKGTLQTHLLRHTGNRPFECTLCPARFNQKGNLRVHIRKTHTAPNEGQKTYKCPHCPCIFKRISSLNGHVTKTHLKYKFTEENIDSVMKNLEDLEQHAFDSYVTLTEASEEGADQKYTVQMKRIGDVRWYKCSYCTKMCKKPSDLIRHLRVHTRERPFKCKICRKSFSLKSSLFTHMNIHYGAKSVKCQTCDSVFSSKKILSIHMRKHENDILSKWECTTCVSLFDDFETALQHKMAQEQTHVIQSVANRVMKQPLYQTVYGNLSFKPPRPRVPNTGNEVSVLRPYRCTQCDARFTKTYNLSRHLQCHEGARKFNCYLCPKAFITACKLKEHINLHSNMKNYPCKVCNKRFVTSTNLKRHMITHNNERPYVCPYCSKNFQTLVLSRRHIRNVHKKDALPKIDTKLNFNDNNNTVLSQATSVITNSKSPLIEFEPTLSSENDDLQQILSEENIDSAQILNSAPLQDESNANLQTYYVNLGDLQLAGNPAIGLSSLVQDMENEQHLRTTEELKEKSNDQQNTVIMYTNLIQPENSLNFASIGTSDTVFDGNTVVQTSVGFNETRNIFDDASIICMNCNKMFSSFVNFQKHSCHVIGKDQNVEKILEIEKPNDHLIEEISKAEEELSREKLTCGICDKDFKQRSSLKKHLKIHSSKRKCPKCVKVFSTKAAYFQHVSTHNKESGLATNNSYPCVFCLKSFKKPSDLERHIRTHTGEKPYRCDICTKTFSLKSTLKSHINTHDPNHKQFGCDICSGLFSSKSSLKVHMTVHTGQLPYSCSTCEAKFRTLGSKKSHEVAGHRQHQRKKVKKTDKNNLTDILKTLSTDIVAEKNKEVLENNMPEYVPLETLSLVVTQDNLVSQAQTLDISSQIVNLGIPPETILSTIPSDQLPVDSSNLLQHLQMTDMVLTTGETEAVPSLILDDVSFLDLNSGTSNLQIISLPETDGRVTISIKENETCQNEVSSKLVKEKPKPIECDKCHKMYASKDGLRKHKRNVHGEKFKCGKCEEKFDSKEKLLNHEKDHCLCTLCTQKFNGEKSLKMHMDKCHLLTEESKEQSSASLNLKLDVPSAAIDETLFNNLFLLKK